MGYKFEQMVKSVKKMRAEGDDTSPFLRVTLENGHRIKVPLDGSEDKNVTSHLRKGVIVQGTFDSIHGWTPEGQRFAQVHTLINADIAKIMKGSYAAAEIDEGIEPMNWDDVQETVQQSYQAPEQTGQANAGGQPDMTALAASLAGAPKS